LRNPKRGAPTGGIVNASITCAVAEIAMMERASRVAVRREGRLD